MQCESGYLCEVCGEDVPSLIVSDLYLRYVLREVTPFQLTLTLERHIRCNPVLAQFIVDPDFEPVIVDGPFSKEFLDPDDVKQREELVTRAWRRLQELPKLHLSISEYPLSCME